MSTRQPSKEQDNINLAIFEQLIPVFQNPGMRLNIEGVLEWLVYNHETNKDITYEEYLGMEHKPKINLPKLDLKTAVGIAEFIGKVKRIIK